MIKCIFGCDDAVVLAYMPDGCVCHPDKWQWLCAQHWASAEPLGPAHAAPEEFLRPIADIYQRAVSAVDALREILDYCTQTECYQSAAKITQVMRALSADAENEKLSSSTAEAEKVALAEYVNKAAVMAAYEGTL